jgi:hypothetical protein
MTDFDHDLYGRVMATFSPGVADADLTYSDGFRDGVFVAARFSAHISAERQPVSDEATNRAYWERNQLVAALSRWYPSYVTLAPDTLPDENWHIVFIETPAGQLSWHVHASEMGHFAHLDDIAPGRPWDGHTTDEKYERLRAIAPQVPVIPEGWELNNISSGIANGEVDYGAALTNGNRVEFGYGPTWLDALNAAIEAAKENDQ